MRTSLFSLAAVVLLISATSFSSVKKLTISSTAFANKGTIPIKYTCVGQSVSPPLTIKEIPEGTRSLTVIIYDEDAVAKPIPKVLPVTNKGKQKTTKRVTNKAKTKIAAAPKDVDCSYTHWMIWNIDAGGFIPEDFRNDNMGLNSSGQLGYQGMCPSTGTHHYHFKVYALDTKINISKKCSRKELMKIMEGHILAEGEMTGTFNKSYR